MSSFLDTEVDAQNLGPIDGHFPTLYKCQLISKANFLIFIWTKKPNKITF